jgi:hypothetical protein
VSRVADLYDRLGGFDAITAVVDSFPPRVRRTTGSTVRSHGPIFRV